MPTDTSSLPSGDVDSETPESDGTPFLQPHISEKYALSWPHVLVCGFFAVLLMAFNYRTLFFSDLWGHVSYGHWILERSTLWDLRLPGFDPFVPLADGVPLVHTAWLSQVAFASIESAGGAEWLSNAYALVLTATFAILFAAFYLQTRRVGVALTGTLIVLAIAWTRILVIRTEIFGLLCCALLVLMIARMRRREDSDDGAPWGLYIAVPIVMALWANLHGSFVMGLALLGCHFLGRAIDVLWTERDVAAVFADVATRRWLILCELAAAAGLLNPYGLELYIHTFTFGSNPNLQTIQEWREMSSRAHEGYGLMLSWVVMLFVFRHSRVRIRPADVLMIGLLSVAVWFGIRMSVWYGMAFGLVMTPHIAELVSRKWPRREPALGPDGEVESQIDKSLFGRSYIHSLVCVMLLWIGFALSPISFSVFGNERAKLYHPETPTGASEFLREHPPAGQIYNPQWWGDWLVWDGPPNLKVMVTTNTAHVLPNRVWRDARLIDAAVGNWRGLLEKYRIDTLVIHLDRQTLLTRQARRLPPEWRIVYEDDHALIASRDKQLLESVDRMIAKRKTKRRKSK